jgi:hypothetical protein
MVYLLFLYFSGSPLATLRLLRHACMHCLRRPFGGDQRSACASDENPSPIGEQACTPQTERSSCRAFISQQQLRWLPLHVATPHDGHCLKAKALAQRLPRHLTLQQRCGWCASTWHLLSALGSRLLACTPPMWYCGRPLAVALPAVLMVLLGTFGSGLHPPAPVGAVAWFPVALAGPSPEEGKALLEAITHHLMAHHILSGEGAQWSG